MATPTPTHLYSRHQHLVISRRQQTTASARAHQLTPMLRSTSRRMALWTRRMRLARQHQPRSFLELASIRCLRSRASTMVHDVSLQRRVPVLPSHLLAWLSPHHGKTGVGPCSRAHPFPAESPVRTASLARHRPKSLRLHSRLSRGPGMTVEAYHRHDHSHQTVGRRQKRSPPIWMRRRMDTLSVL